jgi:hypothetical protein
MSRVTNKYLGTKESEGIQHQHLKEGMKEEYTRRLRMILKAELLAKSKNYSNWSSIKIHVWYY